MTAAYSVIHTSLISRSQPRHRINLCSAAQDLSLSPSTNHDTKAELTKQQLPYNLSDPTQVFIPNIKLFNSLDIIANRKLSQCTNKYQGKLAKVLYEYLAAKRPAAYSRVPLFAQQRLPHQSQTAKNLCLVPFTPILSKHSGNPNRKREKP